LKKGFNIKFLKTKKAKWLIAVLLLFVFYWISLPSVLFKNSTSTILLDKNGRLIGARIAEDGQWRFPHSKDLPSKFEKAIVQFEDRKFFYHPGIDPLAMIRALIHNYRSGKIVNGGSTLSMQVIKLSRSNRKRTFIEKAIESILATRLELSYSKKEILSLYASNAPFGGNVVGVQAAAWRYFGRDVNDLSWAEAATLAVLPNSPSLIYPGKNQEKLKLKRNRLLKQLLLSGDITSEECKLAMLESLPPKPYPIPQLASHLLNRAYKEGYAGKMILSTVNGNLQDLVVKAVKRNHKILQANDINNAAALVLEVESGNVLAYAGNTDDGGKEFSNDVDIIASPRSTGSILKPFLYAAMLDNGEILPNTLVPDIPTQIGGFMPKNFYMTYDGAVPAKRALARSLNVPIVRMLQNYGIEKFSFILKKIGLTTINKPPDHYGLSIILGGGEATLFDLAGAYASMARVLNDFNRYHGLYSSDGFHKPNYLKGDVEEEEEEEEKKSKATSDVPVFSASSIWLTFEAMTGVVRPDEEINWNQFSSSQKIAWKTGTSYGFRDGWAIGISPEYVVAVWAGNANGEGRPGLTGIGTAAPLMFDIFGLLKPCPWFRQPVEEMVKIPLCSKSGCRASDICEQKEMNWVQKTGLRTAPCYYHKIVHLDRGKKWQVTSACSDVLNMVHESWFILPPAQEWYYKSKNPSYRQLPPFREGCTENQQSSMELIYPKTENRIYVPLELDGKKGKTVFEAAHRRPNATIYWHLDDKFIGSTNGFHQLGLNPEKGKHVLTLVDEMGETISQRFEVLEK